MWWWIFLFFSFLFFSRRGCYYIINNSSKIQYMQVSDKGLCSIWWSGHTAHCELLINIGGPARELGSASQNWKGIIASSRINYWNYECQGWLLSGKWILARLVESPSKFVGSEPNPALCLRCIFDWYYHLWLAACISQLIKLRCCLSPPKRVNRIVARTAATHAREGRMMADCVLIGKTKQIKRSILSSFYAPCPLAVVVLSNGSEK